MQGLLGQERRCRAQPGGRQPLGAACPAAEAQGSYRCSDLQVRRTDTVLRITPPDYREVWATSPRDLVLLGLHFDLHQLLYQCPPTSDSCLHERYLEDTQKKTITSTTAHMLNVSCPPVLLYVRCSPHGHGAVGCNYHVYSLQSEFKRHDKVVSQ